MDRAAVGGRWCGHERVQERVAKIQKLKEQIDARPTSEYLHADQRFAEITSVAYREVATKLVREVAQQVAAAAGLSNLTEHGSTC